MPSLVMKYRGYGVYQGDLQLALDARAGDFEKSLETEEQKRNWLPKLAAGELRGGLALKETRAGKERTCRAFE